jgi:hypothetical protein
MPRTHAMTLEEKTWLMDLGDMRRSKFSETCMECLYRVTVASHNTFVGNMSEHETQGPSRKRSMYIEEILGPFPPYSSTITVLQMSLTHGSDPVARTTGETCNRGAGRTFSHRLL